MSTNRNKGGGSGELFPPGEVPEVCQKALRSLRMPETLAVVQICAKLAKVFRGQDSNVGGASVVDGARLFGSAFSNNLRRTIAAAAGLDTSISIPAHLCPQRAAVKAAARSIAVHLVPRFEEALELLRAIAADRK